MDLIMLFSVLLALPWVCSGNSVWSTLNRPFLPSSPFIRGEFDPLRRDAPGLGLGLLRENVENRAVDRVSDALQVMGLTPQLTSMKKVMLTSQAKCNDGSPAGFYYRLSPNSRRWIVFLEGGWYCFNARSCRSRWKTSGHLMSSLGWAEHRNGGGLLSSDPVENPHWWRSNHVYIPYCSSDCWSGTREGKSNLTVNEVYSMFSNNHRYARTNSSNIPFSEVTDLPFMGALILEKVVQRLVFSLGLTNGHSLVLAGSSAGGIGVLLNLDNVQTLLMKLGVDVDTRGIADSAWFLDNKPFAPMDCHDAHTCPPIQAMELGYSLWKSRLPSMCKRNTKDRPWDCFLGYRVLPTIHRPLFIFQWLFDEAQMLLDNVGKPVSKQQWNYIHSIGERIKESLKNISTVFAPSCISHTVLTMRQWNAIKIGGMSLSDSLHCWAKFTSNGNGKSRKVLNSPKENNVRFLGQLPTPSGLSNSPEEKTRLKKFRHHQKKRKKCPKCGRRAKGKRHQKKNSKRTNKKVSTQRKNSLKSVFPHLTNLSSKLESVKGEGEGVKSLPQLVTKSGHLSAMRMLADSPDFSTEIVSMVGERTDVSIASSTAPRRRGRKKGRKRNSRNREKRRRRRRKRKRKNRKRKRNKERRKRKNKKRKKDFPFLNEKNRNPRSSSLSERSKVEKEQMDYVPTIEVTTEPLLFPPLEAEPEATPTHSTEPVCPLHLVDTCSWPHCNPTCPPLINPYTGEEMNRVQLLKSFGLSMVDLAHALGVDLPTLKAMDNKDIFMILSP